MTVSFYLLMDLKTWKVLAEKKRCACVHILVREDLNHTVLSKIVDNNLKFLRTEILINQIRTIVTTVQIPPNSSKQTNLEKMINHIDSLVLFHDTKHIVCGNFNITFLR